MTVQAFKLELDAAFAAEMRKVTGAVEQIGLSALRGVVMKSPVGTGRFKGNWSLSIGAINTAIYETVDKSGGATIAEGAALLDGYPADQWPTIYVQNNLPYAVRLEGGYSGQAPGGMVALTVAELQTQFDKTI